MENIWKVLPWVMVRMNLMYSGVLWDGVNTFGPVLVRTAAACSIVNPLSLSVFKRLHISPENYS